jgi:indole-3-glycerol phosphate synthase
MQASGINHFLVGERMMRADKPDEAFTALFGKPKRI